METIKITRALLDSYRKLLREINLLEKELEDMLQGDHGIGSSVVMDYRKGYPQPQGVTGFDGELYDRRRKILEGKRLFRALLDLLLRESQILRSKADI